MSLVRHREILRSSWLFLGGLHSCMGRFRFANRTSFCATVVLPVECFSSNGQQCLNCLSQLRGPSHSPHTNSASRRGRPLAAPSYLLCLELSVAWSNKCGLCKPRSCGYRDWDKVPLASQFKSHGEGLSEGSIGVKCCGRVIHAALIEGPVDALRSLARMFHESWPLACP